MRIAASKDGYRRVSLCLFCVGPERLTVLERCYCWEEQVFLVREPVELSVSHILASRCTITEDETPVTAQILNSSENLSGMSTVCFPASTIESSTYRPWEEQVFLVREPVELSVSHILASRCTITEDEIAAE
jgi:rhodanese-related sulfurtransferase